MKISYFKHSQMMQKVNKEVNLLKVRQRDLPLIPNQNQKANLNLSVEVCQMMSYPLHLSIRDSKMRDKDSNNLWPSVCCS